MITIKETKPRKLSGQTSLQITFKYNPAIVETIKALPFAIYHKEDFTWEVPTCYLAEVLDKLTFIDSIQLSLYSPERNSGNFELIEDEISGFKFRPFDHQILGINFLLKQQKALLLDSMGVGKSLQMMYYAETLHKRGLIDHCLLICGVDSLRQQWKHEIQKFTNESVIVLGEHITKSGKIRYKKIDERINQLKNPIDEFFVVVNIASLRNKDLVKVINDPRAKNKFGLIAVDEGHRISYSSDQGKNIMRLVSPYKVAATGTLITNNPLSAFGPLKFTENDNSTLTNFKSQYCNFGGFNDSQIVGYKNLDVLQDEIDSCGIRRTFEDISDQMPEKIVDVELVEMSDAQSEFYEAIKAGVREEADKIELNTSNLLALTTRLRQATSCPTVLTTQDIPNSKIDRCVDLVSELISQGEKVVIMGTFKETIYRLADRLKEYNPLVNTGDTSDKEFSENSIRFNEDPNLKVFIGSHAKSGTGLSLPAARYCIMIDTPWTYANFDQSACRIYRVTSKANVFIKVLVNKDTIDERVEEIIETKKELSDYLVDKNENSQFSSILRNIIKEL